MKVVVIGTGYVGLVSGACLAYIGSNVVCVDKDKSKIEALERGQIPIYEPGLDKIVDKSVDLGRLSFSNDLSGAVCDADCVLLAVGTPTDESTGRADLQYVFAAAREVAESLNNKALIVTKSTVPVGTGARVKAIFDEVCPDLECEVASNPEFLREGSAVEDFLKPDRIIIGAESDYAKKIMQGLYQPLIGQGYPILFTNIPTAELIKYSSNAFLAMKIAFANEISDLCEKSGANVDMVIKGMGMDNRIGVKHMNPGPGYGGSCFPKDTLALTQIANDYGSPIDIIETVIKSNDRRKARMADKVIDAFAGDVKDKVIAILGLTFKANTDDMRYSPSLVIVPKLLQEGADVRVYDPAGMSEAKKLLTQSEISWCGSDVEAYQGADAVVVVTEWQEFCDISLRVLKEHMRSHRIIDLRNIFDANRAKELGFSYYSIGRKDIEA